MSDDFNERFASLFHETINDQVEVRDDLTVADVDGWTSLTHINLIYAVEDEFGIELNEEALAGLANLGDLKSMVTNRLSSLGR